MTSDSQQHGDWPGPAATGAGVDERRLEGLLCLDERRLEGLLRLPCELSSCILTSPALPRLHTDDTLSARLLRLLLLLCVPDRRLLGAAWELCSPALPRSLPLILRAETAAITFARPLLRRSPDSPPGLRPDCSAKRNSYARSSKRIGSPASALRRAPSRPVRSWSDPPREPPPLPTSKREESMASDALRYADSCRACRGGAA